MLLGLYGERKKGGVAEINTQLPGQVSARGDGTGFAKGIMAKRALIRALNRGDWTYGEGAMQRGEELLKRIVAFMGV